MSQIGRKDTRPELIVRKYLYGKGYRYRVDHPVAGRPDLAFLSDKIAVFVHGCFWHKHGCKFSSIPKSNTEFWRKKLTGNKKRDNKVKKSLESDGWLCLIVWECELKKTAEKRLHQLESRIEERISN